MQTQTECEGWFIESPTVHQAGHKRKVAILGFRVALKPISLEILMKN